MVRLIDAGSVESALLKWMYDQSDFRTLREVLDDIPTAGAELITKYHQLERERDASVADLNNNWEWRGVKEAGQ